MRGLPAFPRGSFGRAVTGGGHGRQWADLSQPRTGGGQGPTPGGFRRIGIFALAVYMPPLGARPQPPWPIQRRMRSSGDVFQSRARS